MAAMKITANTDGRSDLNAGDIHVEDALRSPLLQRLCASIFSPLKKLRSVRRLTQQTARGVD